jgi:hypothetical protein
MEYPSGKEGGAEKSDARPGKKAAFGVRLTCDGRIISIKWKDFPLWNTITIQSGRAQPGVAKYPCHHHIKNHEQSVGKKF